MNSVILKVLFLSFFTNAQGAPTEQAIHLSASLSCESISQAIKDLNRNLASYDIERRIQVLRCQKNIGLLNSTLLIHVAWQGGMDRCNGNSVGTDFHKFLQLDDSSPAKKVILERLGLIPIQLKNYSYNYMISLCQAFLDH